MTHNREFKASSSFHPFWCFTSCVRRNKPIPLKPPHETRDSFNRRISSRIICCIPIGLLLLVSCVKWLLRNKADPPDGVMRGWLKSFIIKEDLALLHWKIYSGQQLTGLSYRHWAIDWDLCDCVYLVIPNEMKIAVGTWLLIAVESKQTRAVNRFSFC